MTYRGIARVTVALLALCVFASIVHLRRCHADVFAGKGRANWRTAFVGDSLTQFWRFPATNLGIFGQTTAQIRARYTHDVLCHCYRAVVLLAGTNDIGQKVPISLTLSNLDAMVVESKKAGLTTYIGTIPPLQTNDETQPARVDALNAGIRKIAQYRGVTLLEYHDALMPWTSHTFDGVHVDERGYLAMWQVLHDAGAV